MKDYLLNLALAVTVLAIALGYYYGHDSINRLLINAPTSLMQLVSR
jgi:hypothetical protein